MAAAVEIININQILVNIAASGIGRREAAVRGGLWRPAPTARTPESFN
jgi:hypothetical protein